MKKLFGKYTFRVYNTLACLALIVTTFSANTTCMWVTHQPELPKNAKSLRKF